ncbi:MAG: hypothetical protein E7429_04395 [Ruminococcaceae bacterium]|nr:hypothetical protein [Oscillospiraceae bacterium]
MLPIWLMYFMPPLSLAVFVIKLAGVGLTVIILAALLRFSPIARTELFLKGLAFGFLGDLAGLCVFAAVCIWDVAVYDSRYPLICAGAFCVAVFLPFFLHSRVDFKYCTLSGKKRYLISGLITAAAAPWFFFIPQ